MIVEAALAVLHSKDSLPAAAHRGGILTPMVALGDVLADRMNKTEYFEIDSSIVSDADKKTR
jgi:hypothetical protein